MNRLLCSAAAAAVLIGSSAQAQAVTVNASEWKLRLSKDTVRAGSTTFRLVNDGIVAHAIYVAGEGANKGTREVPGRQTITLTVTLKPGEYEVYCPMSDGSHKMAGMTRKLVVVAADTKEEPKKP